MEYEGYRCIVKGTCEVGTEQVWWEGKRWSMKGRGAL